MEERGIRRLLPYATPVLLVVAMLLSAQPHAAALQRQALRTTTTTDPSTTKPTSTVPSTTLTAAPPAPPPPVTSRPRLSPPGRRLPATVAPRPAPAPAPPVPAPLGRGTWAVIVGINDYPGSQDVHFAEEDAHDMSDALSGLGVPGGQIRLLTGGAANGPTVRAAIDWLVANAGPDALGVVFFAGHVRKSGPGAEAFRLVDDDSLGDAELATRLQTLRARRAWIAVAACYGGGFTEVLAPGRILTGAAPADEYAYETTEFHRSYLVQYMVREAIIEHRTQPTVQDAYAYAAAKQRRDYRPVQYEMEAPVLDLRG